MKLYRIVNKAGKTLCFQVGENEKAAIESAKIYGHRLAAEAEFVREQH